MSLEYLQNTGFTKIELKIYEFLISTGEIPVSAVVTGTKIKRPTTYKALNSLSEKGVVTLRDVGKKLHARPEPPTRLQKVVEKKFEEIEQVKSNLMASVNALSSIYLHSTEKPIVRTYEGVEGLKLIYQDMLEEGQLINALVQTGEVDETLFKWLTTKFIRKRKKLRIHAKVIVASGTWAKEYRKRDTDELRTTVEVPFDKFPIEHEVDVFGDKIAFIHYKKNEPLIGVVIHHPGIARTSKAWFDLAWVGAQKQV